MSEKGLRPRMALTSLAMLVSAASSLGAGTTTLGLVVRTAIGGLAFYALGALVEKVLIWAVGSAAALPDDTAHETRGRKVDVTLPAIGPRGGEQ